MNKHLKITALGLGVLFTGATIGHAAPASENWENLCQKCHGADGKGETAIGKKLHLKDYTDAAVQAKMTDEEMSKTISEGIVENGKTKMKPFKETLTKEEINDLVTHVRKFKG
ncbi:MAG TPA: cytochrome c [Rariglobus sp.]|jgi:cytochrome c553|nr:cytochrome c [Rariglobus sp.]